MSDDREFERALIRLRHVSCTEGLHRAKYDEAEWLLRKVFEKVRIERDQWKSRAELSREDVNNLKRGIPESDVRDMRWMIERVLNFTEHKGTLNAFEVQHVRNELKEGAERVDKAIAAYHARREND